MSCSVTLVTSMGDDRHVVNAARVSYSQHTTADGGGNELSEGDTRLINYLARNRHMSPFRHCFVTVHCRQPEFVARQAYKHVVGIATTSQGGAINDHGWNEVSGRYVAFSPKDDAWEGPVEWRGPPAAGQSKQGSTEGLLPDCAQTQAQEQYEMARDAAFRAYESLLHLGVCKEQARAVLPMSFMTEWFWTMSLEAAAHFCKLRMAADAQREIRAMAMQMDAILRRLYPVSYQALSMSGY